MKRYLFFLLASILFVSCKKEKISGSGTISTESRSVENFYNVSVSGSSKVYIIPGSSFDVKVKAYENILPFIATSIQNGSLLIGYKNNANITNDNSEIYISMPSLTGVSISGDGQIEVTGNFLNNDNFTATVSGSGTISITNGTATNYQAKISGSGAIKSFGFAVQNAIVSIDGSGNAEVNVAKSLKATINGSGNIYYKGNGVLVDSSLSGSGQVIKQ
jgi:hypothetical protein